MEEEELKDKETGGKMRKVVLDGYACEPVKAGIQAMAFVNEFYNWPIMLALQVRLLHWHLLRNDTLFPRCCFSGSTMLCCRWRAMCWT